MDTVSGGDRQILCIDDDPGILGALERVLRLTPYTVHTASNPSDGLSIAKRFQPDLILVDVLMPEMSGEEFARRARRAGCGAIIIFMTGLSDLTPAAREMCCNLYIPKPFTNRYVRGVVELVLSGVKDDTRHELLLELAEKEGIHQL